MNTNDESAALLGRTLKLVEDRTKETLHGANTLKTIKVEVEVDVEIYEILTVAKGLHQQGVDLSPVAGLLLALLGQVSLINMSDTYGLQMGAEPKQDVSVMLGQGVTSLTLTLLGLASTGLSDAKAKFEESFNER